MFIEMAPSNMLDLFSGIGGMSLAFHGIFKTVAYCEIDKQCQCILRANMHRSRIDTAPIFEDITKLQPQHISKQHKIHIISAGFPCQNISSCNRNTGGIDGEKSSLFYHVLRLASQIPECQVIILENVANIINEGLEVIEKELAKIGYTFITWSIFSACEVGGIQQRKRWVAAAAKSKVALQSIIPSRSLPNPRSLIQLRNTFATFWDTWKHMSSANKNLLVSDKGHFLTRKTANKRNKMLGNSLVPQMLNFAFMMLVLGTTMKKPVIKHGSMSLDSYIKIKDSGKITYIQKPFLVKRPPLNIPLSNEDATYTSLYFSTPAVSDFAWGVQYLNERTRTLLAPQLAHMHADFSKYHLVRKMWFVRPNFTEYLMGYPKDYTSC